MFAVNYRPQYLKPTDIQPDYFDVLVVDKSMVIKQNELKLISQGSHAFQEVPVIEHINNRDYLGDFEPVISLIDAYNIIQSDRVMIASNWLMLFFASMA